jgi:hypothetical protein
MKRIAPSMLLALAAAATGCGGGGGGSGVEGSGNVAAFRVGIDHPYFPLLPGRVWIYQGDDEGRARDETVRTLAELRPILGVACTALHQEVYLDGVLEEVTTEWFAQDLVGDVWKFGEESLELEDGEMVRTEDSWVAGEGGLRPWRSYLARPRVGDRLVGPHGGGVDRYEYASLAETVVVPAGTFHDCHLLVENPDDVEDSDILLYGEGVGRVSEQNAGGRVDLLAVFQE